MRSMYIYHCMLLTSPHSHHITFHNAPTTKTLPVAAKLREKRENDKIRSTRPAGCNRWRQLFQDQEKQEPTKNVDKMVLCNLCIIYTNGSNKMKPTNPNADTYVEKEGLNTYVAQFPANPLVEHPDLTH